MMRIGAIVINVADRARAATFWAAALGYQASGAPGTDEGSLLEAPFPRSPALALDEADRHHLDLFVDSRLELDEQVARLVSLGARHVDWTYPDGAKFVVLADTEGNLFCVVNTDGLAAGAEPEGPHDRPA